MIEAAGENPEQWGAESLTNADLISLAVVGIATNRSGRVPVEAQLKAIQLVWGYMDDRQPDKTTGAGDEPQARPLMSVEDFRKAVFGPPPTQPITGPAPGEQD